MNFDIESERMLLGMAVLDMTCAQHMSMRPDDFYAIEQHQKIHRAIKDTIHCGKPLSSISVCYALEQMGVDIKAAMQYIAQLVSQSAVTHTWSEVDARLFVFWKIRKAISASEELKANIDTLGPDKAISNLTASISIIDESMTDTSTLDEMDFEELVAPSICFETGIEKLDAGIIGIPCGNMTMLSARPSVGKTAFVLGAMRAWAMQGIGVMMFSQETGKKELNQRMLSAETGINLLTIRKGRDFMSPGQVKQGQESWARIKSWMKNIEVYDRPCKDDKLFSLARRSVRNKGRKIVVVDHAGLVQFKRGNYVRRDLLTEYSGKCKLFARDEDVAFINLWQLNRTAHGEAPNMSQLKDSGAAEQDADLVLLLHATEEEKERDELQIIVDKQRNGPTFKEVIHFDRRTMRFQ